MKTSLSVVALVVFAALSAPAQDGNYMVRYATNLNPAGGVPTDTIVTLTNTGASFGTTFFFTLPVGSGIFTNINGFVCANVYVFSPDEQLQECCQCNLSPNAIASYSAIRDLTSNTLTTAKPNSIVIKIVGTVGVCNAATAGQKTLPGNPDQSILDVPAGGLAAWARNGQGHDTAFQVGTLTQAELSRATALCAFNQVNGSGTGVCKTACTPGGVPGQPNQ